MKHLETVQRLYAAFARGDVATILDALDPAVEWDCGIGLTDVPWLRHRRGREAVPGFFEAMAGFELHRFEPKTFLESGATVVVLCDTELTVRATRARIVEQDEVHLWHFNSAGRVERFAHRLDTHRHWQACQAPAPSPPDRG